MVESEILDELGKKEVKVEDLAVRVLRKPDLLPEIFNGISSTNARTRFNSAKIQEP